MSKDITELGQQILDTILDVVAKDVCLGFIGWDLGKTKEITAYVAKKLGKSNKSVDGGLAHLVATGYFDNHTKTDDGWIPQIGVKILATHKGWLAYSKWNDKPQAVWGDGGPPTNIELDYWHAWDGEDGTTYPFRCPPTNWNKLSSEL